MEEKDRVMSNSVDPLEELSGTALRLYLTLLVDGHSLGIRELQRKLGLKSPSTVRHHLDKLKSLGLVVYDGTGYRAVPPRQGVLSSYIIIRGRFIPKSLAALAFTVTATVAYALTPGNDMVALVVLATSSILQLYSVLEHLRLAKRLEYIIKRRQRR
jgi:DNA-binding transcriptional ArsR family regulator